MFRGRIPIRTMSKTRLWILLVSPWRIIVTNGKVLFKRHFPRQRILFWDTLSLSKSKNPRSLRLTLLTRNRCTVNSYSLPPRMEILPEISSPAMETIQGDRNKPRNKSVMIAALCRTSGCRYPVTIDLYKESFISFDSVKLVQRSPGIILSGLFINPSSRNCTNACQPLAHQGDVVAPKADQI